MIILMGTGNGGALGGLKSEILPSCMPLEPPALHFPAVQELTSLHLMIILQLISLQFTSKLSAPEKCSEG